MFEAGCYSSEIPQICINFYLDNKKEWQHFKPKRCHSFGLYEHFSWYDRYDFSTFQKPVCPANWNFQISLCK